jgi:3-phosphoshikimate 1-carboxyvinyltransferase
MTHPADLIVSPIRHARGRVELPGSKSISNRALLLAALAAGTTRIERLLEADDTKVMIDALLALGVDVTSAGGTTVVVGSGGRFPNTQAKLFLGNAGTAMRPLAAALAFAGGEFELDGVARMRERPIGDLVDALRELGASVAYLGREGYPPLAIRPAPPLESDTVEIRGDVSSQFVSSLLMAAPGIAPPGGLSVLVPGTLISQPYVTLTVRLLERFGISVVRSDDRTFRVPPGTYRSPGAFVVEGDASSASYFLALGVLAGGPVRVLGVGAESIQGDVGFTRILEAAGGHVEKGTDWIEAASGEPLRAFDIDCTDIPDAAMTGAVLAAFAEGRSILRGIGSWRVKETDRIAAMATELRKVGALVEEGPDWIAVTGPATFREASIATYDDHRMAMSMALVAASGVPVRIQDPGCVAKTFPDYFARLAGLVGEAAG